MAIPASDSHFWALPLPFFLSPFFLSQLIIPSKRERPVDMKPVNDSRYPTSYPHLQSFSVGDSYSDADKMERIDYASLHPHYTSRSSSISSSTLSDERSTTSTPSTPRTVTKVQKLKDYFRTCGLGFSQATLHTTMCEALLTLSTILLWNHDLPLTSFPSLTRNISVGGGSTSFVCGQLFPQLIGGWSELEGGLVEGGDDMTGTIMRNAFESCRKQVGLVAGSGVYRGGLLVLFVFVKAIFAYLYIRPDTTKPTPPRTPLHHRPNHSPLPPNSDPTSTETEYTRSHDLLIYSIIIHSTFNLIVYSERANEMMGFLSRERVLMGAEGFVVVLIVGTLWSEWRERVERRRAEKRQADLEDGESGEGLREKK